VNYYRPEGLKRAEVVEVQVLGLPFCNAAVMPSTGLQKVVIAVDMSQWAEMAFDCELPCIT